MNAIRIPFVMHIRFNIVIIVVTLSGINRMKVMKILCS